MIPEYSSLDLEFLGSVEQRDTGIDSKMKGTLRVVSTDSSPDSSIVFKRVKTENGTIEINRSDLFFKSYWESKVGKLIKKGPGVVDIKRFGVSFNFYMEYCDTNFKIKTLFTNPLDKITQPETDHRLTIKCTNSRTEYGMFRGSAAINMTENSYFIINDGSIDGLEVQADKSTLELYLNEINGPINIRLQNQSRAIIKVNPEVESIFRDGKNFNIEADDTCKIEVRFEQVGGHLFGDLMRKYGAENVAEYSKYKKH